MKDIIQAIGLNNIYSLSNDRPYVFVDLCRGGIARCTHRWNVEMGLVRWWI